MKAELKWHSEKDASGGDIFSAVAGMKVHNFRKKRLHRRCFLWNLWSLQNICSENVYK